MHFEHGENVLFHRQLAKNGWLLGQIADAILPRPQIHGNPRDIDFIDENLSRIGSDQTDNHVKAGGLAGAIGTQQPDHFALADLKVYAPNHLTALIRLADFVCTKFLHSFRNTGLGHCLGSTATHHDAIIAIIENQRIAGYCSAHLIGQARRRGAGSGQQKFAIRSGVGELLTGPLAARLLEFHAAPGDDLRDWRWETPWAWLFGGSWRAVARRAPG